MNTEEIHLASHLIDKYRESIMHRYSYEHLSGQFILSSQLTEDVVENLRNYFLECLYPPAEERRKLDAAFDSLRSFILHPAKTWALLGNMAAAIFRFGTQFPQAIKAGVVSLESYIDAKRFEQDLLKAALREKATFPMTDEQFEKCIADIPRKEIEVFTRHILSLFKSMTNTSLLKKTIAIMEDVLSKIKKNEKLYSKQDAEGIELGLTILRKGYDLFKNYPESLKTEIITTIRDNEKWYLDKVYGAVLRQ
ncbi:MAG TPA: hypothetical protein VNJ07_06565 [Chitinophagales bacterium]|nr:hypothetical protein [Chitinophagales bacterium]